MPSRPSFRALFVSALFVVALVAVATPAAAQSTCQQDCFDDYNSAAQACGAISNSTERQACIADANSTYTSCISVGSCNGPQSFPCSPVPGLTATGRYGDGTCIYSTNESFEPSGWCLSQCQAACDTTYDACYNDIDMTFPCHWEGTTCDGCDECCDALLSCNFERNMCDVNCYGFCGIS